MNIAVDRSHDLEPRMMRARLQAMEDKLRSRYHTNTSWVDADTMSIGGPGVRGSVHVDSEHVHVELELSAALRPLKSKIEKLLSKELDLVTAPAR